MIETIYSDQSSFPKDSGYIDIVSPLVHNKETVGMIFDAGCAGVSQNLMTSDTPPAEGSDWLQRRKYNGKRCQGMVSKIGQNKAYYEQLNDFMMTTELSNTEISYLCDYRHKINSCCHNSLFREHLDSSSLTFIGASTCKHKFCAVCNAQRSKKVRKAYRNFFEKNRDLTQKYDFMHLTLTVPHSGGTFRGKAWYADDLMKEFNYMRKKAFWQRMVYAGEFGIEVTKNESGLHIHIHSMLLVHRTKQNRNELHRKIYLAWNKQTSGDQFEPLNLVQREAAKRGNKLITDKELDKVNATGALMMGLESLYIKSDTPRPGFIECKRTGKYKRYVKPSDGLETFMGGVMECIKYHFEPLALQEDGKLNFSLLCELLPAIKGKPLYRKFGAFHSGTKNAHPDAKTLNANYKEGDPAELIDELTDSASEVVTDPATGEELDRDQYTYFVANLRHAHVDPETKLIVFAPGVKRNYLPSSNAVDALIDMEMMSVANNLRGRNQIITSRKKRRRRGKPSTSSFTFTKSSNHA